MFVEDTGVELKATQVADHDVRCCDQSWVFWCFFRVLRDRDCQGACRGQTLSSVQWTHTHTDSDTHLSSVTTLEPVQVSRLHKYRLGHCYMSYFRTQFFMFVHIVIDSPRLERERSHDRFLSPIIHVVAKYVCKESSDTPHFIVLYILCHPLSNWANVYIITGMICHKFMAPIIQLVTKTEYC
jgi:hypothetical protein